VLIIIMFAKQETTTLKEVVPVRVPKVMYCAGSGVAMIGTE